MSNPYERGTPIEMNEGNIDVGAGINISSGAGSTDISPSIGYADEPFAVDIFSVNDVLSGESNDDSDNSSINNFNLGIVSQRQNEGISDTQMDEFFAELFDTGEQDAQSDEAGNSSEVAKKPINNIEGDGGVNLPEAEA